MGGRGGGDVMIRCILDHFYHFLTIDSPINYGQTNLDYPSFVRGYIREHVWVQKNDSICFTRAIPDASSSHVYS